MRKAGDIILDLFRDRFGPGFMENARSTAGLFSSWEKLAAEVWPRPFDAEQKKAEDYIPAAAVHSRIRELERGMLLVEADHPGWIQILQTKQAELLAVVQRRYPRQGIRGIAFRLSREHFSPSNPVTITDAQMYQSARKEQSDQDGGGEPLPAYPGGGFDSRDVPRDNEFYQALKGLEESIKIRNKL